MVRGKKLRSTDRVISGRGRGGEERRSTAATATADEVNGRDIEYGSVEDARSCQVSVRLYVVLMFDLETRREQGRRRPGKHEAQSCDTAREQARTRGPSHVVPPTFGLLGAPAPPWVARLQQSGGRAVPGHRPG